MSELERDIDQETAENLGLETELENLTDSTIEGVRSDVLPRGSSKVTEISVGGVKVKVRTDATPASLKQIRALVDNKFEEFSDKLERGVSAHQLTVLVAFNLAEELLAERERVRLLKRQISETSERLINRVESHLKKLA